MIDLFLKAYPWLLLGAFGVSFISWATYIFASVAFRGEKRQRWRARAQGTWIACAAIMFASFAAFFLLGNSGLMPTNH